MAKRDNNTHVVQFNNGYGLIFAGFSYDIDSQIIYINIPSLRLIIPIDVVQVWFFLKNQSLPNEWKTNHYD